MKTSTFLLALFLFASIAFAQDDSYLKQAREILREVPLIDGHNDLPWTIKENVKNHLAQVDLNDTTKLKTPFQTDIARLRTGMIGGQFWSVYVPVELKGADAIQAVFEQID